MRTIKFRAWDKKRSRFDERFPRELKEFGELGWTLTSNEFEFQQFTGLLDKNGKEIYEGDIIGGDKLRRFEIIWKDGIGDFQQEAGWWMLTGDEVFALHQGRVGKYKVLGNAYENPELLKS